MTEMKRLFAAIKIEPGEAFADIYHNLRQVLGFHIIKWVELPNIHLTLKFFGDTPEEEIPVINQALQESLDGIRSFELKLANTGIFGSYYNPRVIWFGINDSPMLQQLNSNIRASLEKVGYMSDRQNFVPHLTVGRIKEIRDKNHFQEVMARFSTFEFQKQLVDKLYLYESILKREGPEYNVIETFTF